MSNILSASSSTKYVHLRRSVLPASRKSISRPGVAMQISAPVRNEISQETVIIHKILKHGYSVDNIV